MELQHLEQDDLYWYDIEEQCLKQGHRRYFGCLFFSHGDQGRPI